MGCRLGWGTSEQRQAAGELGAQREGGVKGKRQGGIKKVTSALEIAFLHLHYSLQDAELRLLSFEL